MKRGLSLFLILAFAPLAVGQDNKKDGFKINVQVDQKSIDAAISRGIAFLKTSDSPTTSWGGGTDGLKLLTYIHAGVPETDAAFQDLLKKCLEDKFEKTYEVSLIAMCLEEIDRVKYQHKIAQCGQFLLDNIKSNGGFSYGEPSGFIDGIPTTAPRKDVASAGGSEKKYDPALPADGKVKPKVTRKIPLSKKKEGPGQRSDNSNSQYGALGMRACHDAGIVFPKEWVQKCREYWMANQHPGEKGAGGRPAVASGGMVLGDPRGWCYNDGQGTECGHEPHAAYSSMTAGAVGAVCIYDYMLGKEWKKDKVVADGLAWLDKNWSITANVPTPETAKGQANGWLYYYLYALERTGMLYDTALIGNHDWYLDGARYLLGAQQGNGSWNASHFNKPTWDTCFAILFLKRATRRLVATEAGGGARGK